MKKIIRKIKLNIIGLITGVIVASVISVCAATSIASSTVTYNNSTSGSSSTNVSSALDDLYSKAPTAFKIGDYVKMTPAKTTFTIPKTLTGYASDQTIYPSELNLWRVIKINDDKTLDMVSEYISSVYIYFNGMLGYKNYVGTLNYIAKQYENPKYTAGSRAVGYNNQTEYITDTSKLNLNTAPWSSSTSATVDANEKLGGGDVSYINDRDLIVNAIGTAESTSVSSSLTTYWIASRGYVYYSGTEITYAGRVIGANGGSYVNGFFGYNNSTSLWAVDAKNAIRPIVTLKPWIKVASGSGTSSSPYILS